MDLALFLALAAEFPGFWDASDFGEERDLGGEAGGA
jgi:hypothetical protein